MPSISILLFLYVQSAHVVEVQVWSGEGELPARVELYLSLDGATFTLVDILLPAESQLQVQLLCVMNISYSGMLRYCMVSQVMFTVLWNITTDQQELTIEQRVSEWVVERSLSGRLDHLLSLLAVILVWQISCCVDGLGVTASVSKISGHLQPCLSSHIYSYCGTSK